MEMADRTPQENVVPGDPRTAKITNFNPPAKKSNTKCFAVIISIVASVTSILLGYDIGVMSGAQIFIQEDLKLSDFQVEILVGTLNFYALVGSALAGRTSDYFGRRWTVILAGGIFFLGAIFMAFAYNYAFIMCGRFIAGVGIGYGMMIAPVYTTEIAPSRFRGFLSSFPEVFVNVGILLGYISNVAFANFRLNLGWRLMLGVGGLPAIGLAIGVLCFMPESPRWLVMQGRLGDAKRVLERTSDSEEEAQARLADIKEVAGIPEHCNDDIVKVNKKTHGEGVWRDLLLRPTPAVRHILMAAIGLHLFQQISGIDTVVLYSPKIFEKAGIHSKEGRLRATVAVGCTKTIFILVATFLVDRFGRRPLLLTSVGGIVISLLALAMGLTVIDHNPNKAIPWAVGLCVTCVMTNVAFFSIGLGPVTWVYSSEIFPLKLRAQGVAMGVTVNRLFSGIVSTTFLSLYKAITIGGAFFMYGGIAAVAWTFFFVMLPETRGRTLEDIEVLFGRFHKWRKANALLEEKQKQQVDHGRHGAETNV